MSRGPASAAARVVLVVNDDPLVRAYTARVLAEAGYVVFTAEDREEALALARTLSCTGFRGRLGFVTNISNGLSIR